MKKTLVLLLIVFSLLPVFSQSTEISTQTEKEPYRVKVGNIGIVNGSKSGNFIGVTWKDGFLDNLVINLGVGNGLTGMFGDYFRHFSLDARMVTKVGIDTYSTSVSKQYPAKDGVGIQLSSYYLFINQFFSFEDSLSWHVGAGGYIGGGSYGFRFGAQGLVGLSWYPGITFDNDNVPLEVFAEYVLTVGLMTPGSHLKHKAKELAALGYTVEVDSLKFDLGLLGWNIGVRWMFD